MARKTKYTPQLAAEIVKLLAGGCIIEDVCKKVGISHTAYFDWIKRYPEFLESTERAKADANVGAVLSLRKAMMPHDIASETTKTVTETRLRKVRTKDGISEQPYEWTKTERSRTLSNEFDWRAALEFLKRRDPDNWSEHLIIKVTDEQADLLKKHGLTAAQAFEKLIQSLHEVENG